MDILINIKHKAYRTPNSNTENVVIKDLKFTLNNKEFICLVGPSGCGKSTLLNTIAGLDTNFQGKIAIENQKTTPNIGYVFQNPRLLPWRTIRENIELVLSNTQTTKTVDILLEAMQLKHLAECYPQHLSLGMSRRISIIRAFAVNPDILLMDEPFVSLDAPNARQVRKLLLSLWQQRPHSILFVTHDLREAITLADRLVFLSKSPMKILSEIQVPIAREARENEALIENFRQQLITNHPNINALL